MYTGEHFQGTVLERVTKFNTNKQPSGPRKGMFFIKGTRSFIPHTPFHAGRSRHYARYQGAQMKIQGVCLQVERCERL